MLPIRLTSHHYKALAREHQLEWLGKEIPKNIRKKTTWRCAKGHIWEIPYRNIKYDGSGCPHCAGLAPKQAEDYHILAKQRGFIWLGPLVGNVRTKTQWRCDESHTWLATYDSIRQGKGCPTCAGLAPKRAEDYHALAKQRGFEWLGPPVENVRSKSQWRCGKNHTWNMTYNDIQQGAGCPACGGVKRKTEADYHDLAKRRGFEWLGPMVKNTRTKTEWRCSSGHTWLTTYSLIRQGSNCPICAGRKPKTEADYHALAKQRGFKWLGPPVQNTTFKTKWCCRKNHTWSTSYNVVQQGTSCPTCTGIKRKTEADYHTLAELRGLDWLGPLPKNVNTKSRWRCGKGHAWLTTYSGIRRRGKCPICSKIENQPKT